jgi:hypothetical protein
MLPLGLKVRVLHDAEAPAAGDDCYGLLRCQGFDVYDQDGRVGTVRRVRFGQTLGMPDALVVRTGLFIRQLVLIPTAEIDEISPNQHRVLVRRRAADSLLALAAATGRKTQRLGGTR